MAPTLLHHLVTKLTARVPETPTSVYAKGPLAARAVLVARDAATTTAVAALHAGVTSVDRINNKGMFALFGILGAAICVGIIWFFFWAKNGGFYFRENDWDDYKTTVLRRRGPNGTLLSNATPSTNLGGGSIYKDVDDGSTTVGSATVITVSSGTTDVTGITGGVSDFMGREKRRKKREQRERDKERRREEKVDEKARGKKTKAGRSSRKVNEEGVLVDEMAEAEAEAYLRNYRHEKAARVGGINKASDASNWDGSTNPSASTASASEVTESTVTSELMANREHTPTNTPTKKGASGGIRKVYSTADRNAAREQERIRAEARRLQERGARASHSHAHHRGHSRGHGSSSGGGGSGGGGGGRRDFSWQYGEDASTPLRQIDEGDRGSARVDDDAASRAPGAWQSDAGATESDVGTKAYVHHIPGLSTSSAFSDNGGGSAVSAVSATEASDYAYAEEKRKLRQQKRSSAYRRE